MEQPIMRASVWNAVRDAVDHALLDPRAALTLVEAAVPHEDQDSAIAALSTFTLNTLVARLLPDPTPSAARFHRAVRRRMESAEAGSGLQVAAARGAVASCADPELLGHWLAGEDLPAGLQVDLDLRWRVLVRLATLGATTPDELREHLDRENTTEAAVHHVQARASLPDAAAKAYAWEHFDGARDATNYEIEAAGLGLWRRGQESVTASYVDRYFAEVGATAKIRHGWVLAEAARGFFPVLAVEEGTVAKAERVLDDPALDASLRRALVDCTDDLRRAVRVRATFG
jgi:aminopeptidase N